ncbi:MAG TPA: plastocyanin/azurin family copper-binding protein [Acidimicrobiales bacterium]
MIRRRVALAALAVLLAAGGAACGGDDDSAAGDDGGSGDDAPGDVVVLDGSEVEVQSLDNTFRPQAIQVAPGTSVTWTNDGRNEHDVLPVEGDDWGVEVEEFQPGATYEHTFDRPGTYDYYCSIHGTTTAGMIGTVVVAD